MNLFQRLGQTALSRWVGIFLVINSFISVGLERASGAGEAPLVFLGDKDYPPVAYLEEGVPKGMDVDLAKALGEVMKREVRIELMDWNLAQEKVLKSEADGLLGLSISEERRKLYDFAEPTFTREFVLVVRSGEVTVHGVGDLKAKRLGMTAGGFPRAFLKGQPGINEVPIDSYRDGLDRLSAGTIDAMAADRWVTAYLIEKGGIHGITIVKKPFAKAPCAIAVRKGNAALLDGFNRAIQTLKTEGKILKIQESWRPQQIIFISRERARNTITTVVGVLMVVVFGAMGAWILSLRRQERERRKVEQELRWRTAFFEAQVHSAIDGILVVNSQGRKILQNQRMTEMWKIPPEIAADPDDTRQIRFILDRVKDPQPYAEKVAHLYAHPDETSADEIVLTDGTVFDRYSAPVRGSDGKHYGRVWTFRDITERKKLEEQFLRAQRMESIGTLAGGIAHDLNNTLGPIILSIELLKEKFPDPDSQDVLSVVRSSAQRGADMVRQVLSFARGVEGRRMDVQVRHLVQEIEKLANDTFLKNIQVRTFVPFDLWTVLGDPTQLHQVLLNLCVNARDAMPGGGKLTISARNITLDEHYAALHLEARPGPYVLLQVKDSGTGMPPEVIKKIFDPFYTTKDLGKGTGLGLSTSLGIVKSHGGFIRVYSEVGEGATFEVYLPAQKEISPGAAAQLAAELPRGHGELILVVDDEISVRQITQQTLGAFGYRVVLAVDGVEAVAIYARERAEIAAVITDMAMPVMDGPATIEVLRRMNPAVRIIAASGLAGQGRVTDAMNLGVKHFLPKPYTAETLLKALRDVLSAE